MRKLFRAALPLIAIFPLWLGQTAVAQDEFSIPGVDDPAAVTDGGGGESPAGASNNGGGDSGDDAPKSKPKPKKYGSFLSKLIGVGGFFIWPLIILSVAVVGLTIYCFIDLRETNFYPDKLVKQLREDMDHTDVARALDHSKKSNTCLGQVMYGATEYIGDRGFQVLDDNGLYDSMADASQEFNRGRARTINWLSVIAQVSPMVGLLGTVSGMIKAFDALGDSGMGDPSVLATNISEALYTTATGLVVAVPALFAYFYLRDQLTKRVSHTDREAYRLLNTLRRAIVRSSTAGAQPPAAPQQSPPESGGMVAPGQ